MSEPIKMTEDEIRTVYKEKFKHIASMSSECCIGEIVEFARDCGVLKELVVTWQWVFKIGGRKYFQNFLVGDGAFLSDNDIKERQKEFPDIIYERIESSRREVEE